MNAAEDNIRHFGVTSSCKKANSTRKHDSDDENSAEARKEKEGYSRTSV